MLKVAHVMPQEELVDAVGFLKACYVIGGVVYSLSDIEQGIFGCTGSYQNMKTEPANDCPSCGRPRSKPSFRYREDCRVSFALSYSTESSALPIAYTGKTLERQLSELLVYSMNGEASLAIKNSHFMCTQKHQ